VVCLRCFHLFLGRFAPALASLLSPFTGKKIGRGYSDFFSGLWYSRPAQKGPVNLGPSSGHGGIQSTGLGSFRFTHRLSRETARRNSPTSVATDAQHRGSGQTCRS